MNLTWVIALFRPLDIAPHPNFREPDYNSLPPVQLAGVVSGDPSRWSHSARQDYENDGTIDQAVSYASLSLTTDGLRDGLNGLLSEAQRPEQDLARSCALVLLACCAAAELEDYAKIDAIIDEELGKPHPDTPEGKLVQAALLQQKSLRNRDTGRPYSSLTSEVLSLLDALVPCEFQEFMTSPGTSVDYIESVQDVITSLRHAAWSLTPFVRRGDNDSEPLPAVPTWQEIVRTPKSIQAYKVDQLRASEYAKFVQISYDQMFRSQTKIVGGQGAPSLFYAALNNELRGDFGAYHLRKETALLKFLQYMSAEEVDAREVADCLRLLRHSNAKSELDLAVERVRASGPLEALQVESAQILLNRREPRMISASELRVLRGAADLMDQREACDALELVTEVVRSGGAQSPPGTSQLDVVRLEPAWITAAHLANIAEECNEVALLLLQAARDSPSGDELRDKAIGRALNVLNWATISVETRAMWDAFFKKEGPGLPVSRRVFDALTSSRSSVSQGALENLEDVANRLNSVIDGNPMSRSDIESSIEIVKSELAQISSNSSKGLFSFRFLEPADVAAALIIHCGATNVWAPLSDFLVNSNVQRSDKADAFDRLAYSASRAPEAALAKFRDSSEILLDAPGEHFDNKAVLPFPAALRFLASQGVLTEVSAFSLISQMFGRGAPGARVEASRTVAALATSVSSIWLLAQAMQFSHDSEPAVRGHAARALSVYSTGSTDFAETARERLTEMMTQEAILVPLLAIRQIQQIAGFPDAAKQGIGHLALTHPSAIVRKEALKLLGDTE